MGWRIAYTLSCSDMQLVTPNEGERRERCVFHLVGWTMGPKLVVATAGNAGAIG